MNTAPEAAYARLVARVTRIATIGADRHNKRSEVRIEERLQQGA